MSLSAPSPSRALVAFTMGLLLIAFGGAPALAQKSGESSSTAQPSATPDAATRKAGARLDALLTELGRLDAKAWEARIVLLQAELIAQREKARQLRARAEKLLAQAEAADAQAADFARAIGRQRKLAEAVAELRGLPTPKLATKPAGIAKSEAAPSKRETVASPANAKAAPARAIQVKEAAAAKARAQAKAKQAREAKEKAAKQKAAEAKAAKAKAAKAEAEKAKAKAQAMAEAAAAAAKPLTKPASGPNFEDDIRPIFDQHCTACHNQDDASGGLDLSSLASLLEGGGSGSVLTPKDADASRLFRLVNHDERPAMPPRSFPIAEPLRDTLRKWIDTGAPADAAAAQKLAKKSPKATPGPDAKTKPGKGQEAVKDAAEGATKAPASTPPLPKADALSPFQGAAIGGPMHALAASPTAELLATTGSSGELRLWSTATRTPLGALPFPYGTVHDLQFSRDGELLLAGGGRAGETGGAVLYRMREGTVERDFGRRYDTVTAVALSPRATLIALSASSAVIHVHRRSDGKRAYRIEEHDDWVVDLAFSPDGNFLASGDRKGRVVVSEADTGLEISTVEAHAGGVAALAFQADAKRLATLGSTGRWRVWDHRDGRRRGDRSVHPGGGLALVALPGGWWSAGGDGRVRRLDGGGRVRKEAKRHADWVYSLALLASGKVLVTGDWQGELRWFTSPDGKPLAAPAAGLQ